MPDFPTSNMFQSRMAALFGGQQQTPYTGDWATYGESGGEHNFFGGGPLGNIPTSVLVGQVGGSTAPDTGKKDAKRAAAAKREGQTGQRIQGGDGGFFLSPGRNSALGLAGWLPGGIGAVARTANAGLGILAETQKQDAIRQMTGLPSGNLAQTLFGGATGLGGSYSMGGYGVPGQGGMTGMYNALDPGVAGARGIGAQAAQNYAKTGRVDSRETRNDRERSYGNTGAGRSSRERTTGRMTGGV